MRCGTGSASSARDQSPSSASVPSPVNRSRTLMYSSHTSMKNARIPSSFFPSWSKMNFISSQWLPSQLGCNASPLDSLPGVTKAETVHSLNLSTDLRYLHRASCIVIIMHRFRAGMIRSRHRRVVSNRYYAGMCAMHGVLTSRFRVASHPQSRRGSRWRSSG